MGRRLDFHDDPDAPQAGSIVPSVNIVVTNAAGEQVGGYQVHLGGSLGVDANFGRKLRGLKVTEDELEDYVERLANRYLEQRVDGERFTQWVHRADAADLQ